MEPGDDDGKNAQHFAGVSAAIIAIGVFFLLALIMRV